jgi:tetratricopeptide (TPR) repeat protein
MTRTIDDILLSAAKLYEKGEYERAIAELEMLLRQQNSAAAYHLRSRCYRALGDNMSALADLNESLKIHNTQGYRERAQLHFLTKRSDLALIDNQLAEKYASHEDADEDEEEEDGVYSEEESFARFPDDDELSGLRKEREADDMFDRVYEEREAYFDRYFGAMPPDVLKLNNMMGVWPGGCLVQIHADALPDQPFITATFGLTNPDMPASVRSEDVVHEERTEGDKVLRSTSMRLVARDRVHVPEGLAGYGYEIVVITPELYDWPTLFLSWFVTNEINHDAGWLHRVLAEEAVVVKCPIRENPRLKLLIAKAADPLPSSIELPNGLAHILVATTITESEYRFANTTSAAELLKLLRKNGPGQTSIIFRSPCI